jgi:predicted DsbA family dithiol-disulfide isomerase
MSEEKKAAITQRVNQVGQSVGIEFRYGGKIGSTRDAHRLIYLSQSKGIGVQDMLVEGLFEAFHELERDISDCGVLREIAVDAGLVGEEVDECLSTDMGGEVVDEEAKRNRERVNNSGVPYFIIQGIHVVDGAQDFQEFFEAFVKVKEEEKQA